MSKRDLMIAVVCVFVMVISSGNVAYQIGKQHSVDKVEKVEEVCADVF